jgi:hypothetical protein
MRPIRIHTAPARESAGEVEEVEEVEVGVEVEVEVEVEVGVEVGVEVEVGRGGEAVISLFVSMVNSSG